jgi:hypothetical protein
MWVKGNTFPLIDIFAPLECFGVLVLGREGGLGWEGGGVREGGVRGGNGVGEERSDVENRSWRWDEWRGRSRNGGSVTIDAFGWVVK